MDLRLTDEQQLLQETAREFASNVLEPASGRLDRTADSQLFLDNIRSLAELGFMGMNIDPDFGGCGVGTVGFSLAITELARGCASTAVTTSVTNMVAEVIQSIGTETQKLKYLPEICSGGMTAAGFCLSESGAGSDPAGMKTRAVRSENGDWILNGSKMWISSAPYSGVFVVWAVSDNTQPRGKGISCFLVPANTAGLQVGEAEKKMGQRASKTCSVMFEDCRLPESALLGKENEGYRIAITELAGGRIGIASLALGVGLAAMDYARKYIIERKQFERSISEFQGVQWPLVDAYTELEAARLLVLQAAWLKQTGKSYTKEAAMAKLYATEAANRACYTAIQLAGGIGYTEECPLERYSRDVRVTTIYEGTSEIQRIVIAKSLLNDVSKY